MRQPRIVLFICHPEKAMLHADAETINPDASRCYCRPCSDNKREAMKQFWTNFFKSREAACDVWVVGLFENDPLPMSGMC
jgi:hypothetical protein